MAMSWAQSIAVVPGLPAAPAAAGPTELLRAWRSGDQTALDRLMPLVYDALSRQAHLALRGERGDHTLETRALVHEAYLRLIDTNVDWQGRAHFLALAARTMRRILVDHAKARDAGKRGGGATRVTLSMVDGVAPLAVDVLAVHEALDRLAAQDPRKAECIEWHYFGGVSQQEIADLQQVSLRTVERELRLARAWLRRELRGLV